MTPRRVRWIEDAERVDLAIYAAVAGTPTPALDGAMSRLSRAAVYSRLSLTAAAVLALTGAQGGRRAAGLAGSFRSRSRRPSSTSLSSPSYAGGAPTGSREKSRSHATSGCRSRARSRPDTRPPPSRSRPASATCRRRPALRCGFSPPSSPTRASTPAFTTRAMPCWARSSAPRWGGAAHDPRVRPDRAAGADMEGSFPATGLRSLAIAATASILDRARHAVIAPMA